MRLDRLFRVFVVHDLIDTLVLPILSYGCEVWGVDTKCGAAAEALHWAFLRRLLGVKSTTKHMVLAELGRLQIHFWQKILRYHHRTIASMYVLLSSQWSIALLWIRQQSKTVGSII